MTRIAVIGGGIAGLYLSYQKILNSNSQIDLYEASEQLGGRMESEEVDGVPIEGGAGIIRSTDHLTLKLLNELGVKSNFWLPKAARILYVQDHQVTPLVFNYPSIISSLPLSNSKTFLEVLNRLPNDQRIGLIIGSSYSEMLDSGASETIQYNNWDEFLYSEHEYGKPKEWKQLIDALKNKLSQVQIYLSTPVQSIQPYNDQWMINSNLYDQVYITCSPKQIDISIPKWKQIIKDYYFETNYLRVYSFFENDIPSFDHICTNLPVRRIIFISPKVVMTVYTDGSDADVLNQLNQKELNQVIVDSLYVLGITVPKPKKNVKFYWKNGIPSWRPMGVDLDLALKYIQNPEPNLFFCGDRYSHHPGWIEGALYSVTQVI